MRKLTIPMRYAHVIRAALLFTRTGGHKQNWINDF